MSTPAAGTGRSAARDADAILRAAIAAADPRDAVRALLADTGDGPVILVAVGKAACGMADAARAVLGRRVAAALVVVPHGTICDGAVHAGHPLPDVASERAARAVAAIIDDAPGDALIIVLLSGGASALATLPVEGVTIADYADCVRLLQHAGADIRDVNTVRRHIDRLKGGGLARLAAPRRVLGIVLSDVVGDPLDIIASGPLTPHGGTAADAVRVLRSRDVWERCASSVRAALERVEPHVDHDDTTSHVQLVLAGGNGMAVDGAAAAARALGYRVIRRLPPVTGEAADAGRMLVHEALATRHGMQEGDGPICIVAGGETTVTVRGAGTGGRNQEMVLAAAIALAETAERGITVASAGTDGIDGTSDAAGAIADAVTVHVAHARGMDAGAHLADNDSDGFFRAAGGRFVTGPTGTNVMDVQLVLIEPPGTG